MSSNQLDTKAQAWSALFNEPMSELVKRYTASVFFDKRLAQADIAGSLAHADMLAAVGIISATDLADIQRGLSQVREEIAADAFNWQLDLEDVHLNIEARLTQLVGDAGKRLHTGRSRNDQVATDIRLWLRDEMDVIDGLLAELQLALVEVAEQHVSVILPGFTHLQVAQPVSFAHHLLAYVEMFHRDQQRMQDVRKRVNQLPLGSAALAGTTYPLDRERVAKTLGMDGVCQNSLDAVSDRDFAIEFTAAASLVMIHVSRLSEELIIWMSQNFGFVKISDRFTTGSSIMPQKKNPSSMEHAKAVAAVVAGDFMAALSCVKNTSMSDVGDGVTALNEPVLDACTRTRKTLALMAEVLDALTVHKDAMLRSAEVGFGSATELSDVIVRESGMSFRMAHNIVGRVVRETVAAGKTALDITAKDLDAACRELFGKHLKIPIKAVTDALDPAKNIQVRTLAGGPAPKTMRAMITACQKTLATDKKSVNTTRNRVVKAREKLLKDAKAFVAGKA